MPFRALALSALAATLTVSCGAQETKKEDAPEKAAAPAAIEDIRAVIKTNKGDIKIVLFAKKAPVTAANFLNLAKRGYYDGVTFHRVEPGFVIQGGDPDGTGRGGPGYTIELEVSPDLLHHSAGVLSMARKPDPNSAGSQFFITLDKTPHLDGGYAVFGEVTEGLDVVQKIAVGDKMTSVEVLDSTDALFTKLEKRVAEWNKALDQRPKP
ncbi:MAG: peptidylprolyl isomerase [Verrucomicrobiae bacterium]|nr:peptidylprolyl isomerase [Verrucomicrobiae bacterium]